MNRTAVIALVFLGAVGAFGYWFFLAPGSPPSGRAVPLPEARGFLIVEVAPQLAIDRHRERDRRPRTTTPFHYGGPYLLAVPASGDYQFELPLEEDWRLLIQSHGWHHASETEVQLDGVFQTNISVHHASASYAFASRPLGATAAEPTLLADVVDDSGDAEIAELIRFRYATVTQVILDPMTVLGEPMEASQLARAWDAWPHVEAFELRWVCWMGLGAPLTIASSASLPEGCKFERLPVTPGSQNLYLTVVCHGVPVLGSASQWATDVRPTADDARPRLDEAAATAAAVAATPTLREPIKRSARLCWWPTVESIINGPLPPGRDPSVYDFHSVVTRLDLVWIIELDDTTFGRPGVVLTIDAVDGEILNRHPNVETAL